MNRLRSMARLMAPCAAIVLPAPVHAETGQRHAIAIEAGPLDSALRTLAQQTGAAIGGTDRALARLTVPAVSGRMTIMAALKRLLKDSGFRAVSAGANSYRIERTPDAARSVPPSRPVLRDAEASPPAGPIIVIASKRGTDLAHYPGGVQIAGPDALEAAATPPSLETLLAGLPQTSGTQLGAGRNKIFVRGIADSSFNGPTQATTGLYLGEQRLTYSAPNPDLMLYDMASVELIEGPQGTLYGAGALAGVIRMTPAAPLPGDWHARGWSGGEISAHGEPGFDGAAMINAPLGGSAAIRLLGYGGRTGGYIRDDQRGLDNVNRDNIAGFRAATLLEFGDGWDATLAGFGQRRRTRDGQYIDRNLPGLARKSLIAQPFSSDIIGGNLTVHGRVGSIRLVSATAISANDLDTRYDSSVLAGGGAVQAYDESRRITLISHETRLLSAADAPLSWLAGVSLLRNRDDYTQLVTSLNGSSPPPFADIRYRIDEMALFGETSLKLDPRLTASLGGRLVRTRSRSVRYFGTNVALDSRHPPLRFLPMAALSWRPGADLLVYARYQRSYRTGGVTVERADDGTPIPTQFSPDHLQSAEIGLRHQLKGAVQGQLSLAGFYTQWTDIQGDLIQAQGFPITRNIGDGWVAGLTAQAKLRFGRIWHADAALFLNHSEVDRLTPQQTINNRRLPNIADIGFSISAGADIPLAHERTFSVEAGLRYTGKSFLDIDPTSQLPQGDYADTYVSAALKNDRWTLSLALTNLLDTKGNRFAFGNPFAVRLAPQSTPLRPRTLRAAISWGF